MKSAITLTEKVGTHPRYAPKSRNRSKIWFMALWKKIAIVLVAWVGSVLVYLEFFKAR